MKKILLLTLGLIINYSNYITITTACLSFTHTSYTSLCDILASCFPCFKPCCNCCCKCCECKCCECKCCKCKCCKCKCCENCFSCCNDPRSHLPEIPNIPSIPTIPSNLSVPTIGSVASMGSPIQNSISPNASTSQSNPTPQTE